MPRRCLRVPSISSSDRRATRRSTVARGAWARDPSVVVSENPAGDRGSAINVALDALDADTDAVAMVDAQSRLAPDHGDPAAAAQPAQRLVAAVGRTPGAGRRRSGRGGRGPRPPGQPAVRREPGNVRQGPLPPFRGGYGRAMAVLLPALISELDGRRRSAMGPIDGLSVNCPPEANPRSSCPRHGRSAWTARVPARSTESREPSGHAGAGRPGHRDGPSAQIFCSQA